MSIIHYIIPNWFGTGLSNQLFFIILGIIDTFKNKKKILVIDKFRQEPLKDSMCYISEVLDLDYLNTIVKGFGIEIIDCKDLNNFKITKIMYGSDNNYYDVTNKIIKNFYTEKKLLIPDRFPLNDLEGDPIFGIRKCLKIYFTLNNKEYIDIYDEYLFNGVNIDLNSPIQVPCWEVIDSMIINERPLFCFLLKNIKFIDKYYKLADNLTLIDKNKNYLLLNDLNTLNKKINVIHLRLEKDITYNMAGHNNMSEKDYIDKLEKKYVNLINKNFDKNDILFILSYELENNVINFLKDNNYEFYFTKKNMFEWREPHAIIDLLLSERCNSAFIGNWQHHKTENMGSTFSYVIDVRLKQNVKKIFIDLCDISKDEIEM
jgi:hypothetical protein